MNQSKNKIKKYKANIRNLSLGLILLISMIVVMGFDSQQKKIFDEAGLLTESQINNLSNEFIKVAQKTNLDIAMVTTNDDKGKTPRTYAEDFYRSHEFGYDRKGGDGVILLIDMDKRKVYISTFGLAVDKISDSRVDSIISSITPYLKNEDYANAGRLFLDEVEGYMSQSTYGGRSQSPKENTSGKTERQVSSYQQKSVSEKLAANMPTKILIAAIGSAVVILIMVIGSRSRMTVGSSTYIKDHKFDVLNTEDIYINTTVVKRKIETKDDQNNSGGGSGNSTKTGGGGGSF